MEISSGKVFVLTGAGFSKNFGGFLGSEMWSQIFNNRQIQADTELRDILKNDYDYESVYSKTLDGQLPEEKKRVMRSVVLEAYKRLDDSLRGWVFNDSSSYPVNPYLLSEMLGRIYSSARPAQVFLFTLNQDLFMERQWNYGSPGVPRFARAQNTFGSQSFNATDFVELPRDDIQNRIQRGISDHAGLHYIKLHGSYGWKSSDGLDQLVVGTNKESLIQNEPLLQGYFDLFTSIIKEGSKKVLIIGYGFRDAHINALLLEGVEKYGLEIYIISTQPPADLRHQIENGQYYAKGILDLDQFSSFHEFQYGDGSPLPQKEGVVSENTPEESMEEGYQSIQKSLEADLLSSLKNCSPSFFEQVVIDLLLGMGYGGSRLDAGQAIGKSGDEGIDGIIKEDKLGLDLIYLQAKRWTNPVGRPEVQSFVGALSGKFAKKGVFITTSNFTQEALGYVKKLDCKVILIDGLSLVKLMIEHNVGVSVLTTYSIKKVDSDYFSEE